MFIEELLTALDRAQVRYCLVGGVAVNLHGIPRMTYDVDLVASMTRESLEALDRTAVRVDVSGIAVWIASLQDLIDLKRASDRKQDADDVRLLEGLKR